MYFNHSLLYSFMLVDQLLVLIYAFSSISKNYIFYIVFLLNTHQHLFFMYANI